MSYIPIEDFPALPGESWADLQARHSKAMAGKIAPRKRRRGFRLPDRTGYHPGLARPEVSRVFGFDPRAHVESDEQLRRLVDVRRRETGADLVTPAQAWDYAMSEYNKGETEAERDLLGEALEEVLHSPEPLVDPGLDDVFDETIDVGE